MKAKFKCQQVNKLEFGEQAHLSPVHGDSEENKTYSKFTPSGKLEIMITNEAVFDFFKPGKSYVLDITESAD